MRRLVALVMALLLPATAVVAAPHWLGDRPAETPTRIVTLAPSITEMVIDLGGADRLVGVSRHDDAPEVRHLPRVGGYVDPAPEAVLRLEPDVVLVQPSPGNRGPVERLAALGIPVLVLPLEDVDQTLASVRAVGEALGEKARGQALATRIEKGLQAARKRARGKRPRAVLVYGWQPLVVAGPTSFAHELLVAAGGENVAASIATGAYPTLSAEALLAAEPALVIDATGGHGGGGAIPGLEAPVHTLSSAGLFRPGPRMLEALAELESLLRRPAELEADAR